MTTRALTERQLEIIRAIRTESQFYGRPVSNSEVWTALGKGDFSLLRAELLVLKTQGCICWDEAVARWYVPGATS